MLRASQSVTKCGGLGQVLFFNILEMVIPIDEYFDLRFSYIWVIWLDITRGAHLGSLLMSYPTIACVVVVYGYQVFYVLVRLGGK